MTFNKAEFKGKSTFHPDCSDKSAYPWGFDTFDLGTVGGALLDWFINGWDEVDYEVNIVDGLTGSLNFYMNDEVMARELAKAWLRDYQEMLFRRVKFGSVMGMIQYEQDIREWLEKEIHSLTSRE